VEEVMSKRHSYGNGTIDARGPDRWRLRYRINKKRFSTAFHGTNGDARKELRRLLRTGDAGEHVTPDRMTLSQWCDKWLLLLSRGEQSERRRGLVSPKSVERYRQLFRHLGTLGARPLQQITATDLDELYVALEQRLSARTVSQFHWILKSCLAAAVRKRHIARNPAADAEAPRPGEISVGRVLDSDELAAVVRGFQGFALYGIVAVAAFTGMRRNEILALQWRDIDPSAKTIHVRRSLEWTKAFGSQLKEPKTRRGNRVIQINDGLLALLLAEKQKFLQIVAGIPGGADIDLSLIRFPEDALVFPSPLGFVRAREAESVSRDFRKRIRKLGYRGLRFHDLRGSHETILLDQGVPVHVVAARCGHDPAVLLRSYAKRTKKADASAAAVIGILSKGVL
jgi:integrase